MNILEKKRILALEKLNFLNSTKAVADENCLLIRYFYKNFFNQSVRDFKMSFDSNVLKEDVSFVLRRDINVFSIEYAMESLAELAVDGMHIHPINGNHRYILQPNRFIDPKDLNKIIEETNKFFNEIHD